MSTQVAEHCNFDHPSFWFVVEDKIKSLFGGSYYARDIRNLTLKGGESVLDFGCGGGTAAKNLVRFLGPQGYLLGVDTSPYWVDIAAKRLKKYPNAQIKLGDIRTMNIPERSMDAILAVHVLHHISQAERLQLAMALPRLLKKKGRLVVRELINPEHGMVPEELKRVLLEAGLKELFSKLSGSEYRGVFIPNSD